MTESFDKMFADLISQAQSAVDGLGPSAEQLEAAEKVSGHAFDNRITVSMKAGRVTRVEIQPPARRLEAEELGEQLVIAMNKALDANLAAVLEQQGEQPDFEALTEQLQSVQAESVRQLDKYTQGMYEMLRNAKELGGGLGAGGVSNG